MSGNPVEAVIPIIMGIIYFAAWYYAKDQPKLIAEKLEASDTWMLKSKLKLERISL